MPVEVRIDKERKCVVIELPMEKARPSASGKTVLIATSHGLASGEATYSGRPVMVAASAFVYPGQSAEPEKHTSGETTDDISELRPTQQKKQGAKNKRQSSKARK